MPSSANTCEINNRTARESSTTSARTITSGRCSLRGPVILYRAFHKKSDPSRLKNEIRKAGRQEIQIDSFLPSCLPDFLRRFASSVFELGDELLQVERDFG